MNPISHWCSHACEMAKGLPNALALMRFLRSSLKILEGLMVVENLQRAWQMGESSFQPFLMSDTILILEAFQDPLLAMCALDAMK